MWEEGEAGKGPRAWEDEGEEGHRQEEVGHRQPPPWEGTEGEATHILPPRDLATTSNHNRSYQRK